MTATEMKTVTVLTALANAHSHAWTWQTTEDELIAAFEEGGWVKMAEVTAVAVAEENGTSLYWKVGEEFCPDLFNHGTGSGRLYWEVQPPAHDDDELFVRFCVERPEGRVLETLLSWEEDKGWYVHALEVSSDIPTCQRHVDTLLSVVQVVAGSPARCTVATAIPTAIVAAGEAIDMAKKMLAGITDLLVCGRSTGLEQVRTYNTPGNEWSGIARISLNLPLDGQDEKEVEITFA